LDTGAFGGFHHAFVEGETAETEAGATGEIALDGATFSDETDASKFHTVGVREFDAESCGVEAGIGHQTFATGFVERRTTAVGQDNGEAFLAGGDGCSETGGASTDDEDVGLKSHGSPLMAAP
jgi:hypothetical protein